MGKLYWKQDRLVTYLDPEIVKRLDDYRQPLGLSRADVQRLALIEYLRAAKREAAEPVTSELT